MRFLMLAAVAVQLASAGSFSLSATTSVSLSVSGTEVDSQTGVNPVMSSSAITFNSTLPCSPGPNIFPPCSANVGASATASATYGQISLSATDYLFTGSAPYCCYAHATASGSFEDVITLFGGTGSVNVDFVLLCSGNCPSPFFPNSAESVTFIAPSQETIGVPFDVSVSISVRDYDNPLLEVAPTTFFGSAMWTLYAFPPHLSSLYYTTESGNQYAGLDGSGLTFTTAPEPGSIGLAVVGILGMLTAAGVRRRHSSR
jgi:hypothetical protein